MSGPAPARSAPGDPLPAVGPVSALEELSTKRLLKRIEVYAPHLESSFVAQESWWSRREGLPEAHMFKHLIFQGLTDISQVFTDAKAGGVGVVKAHLAQANEDASPVWNSPKLHPLERLARCKEITDPVVELSGIDLKGNFLGIPTRLIGRLNKAFQRYYKGDQSLLIGQTHEEARGVQDQYGRAVARIVGEEDARFAARAIICFRKVHGRTSMPLLTISSVQGLWQMCQTSFYTRVISLLYRWIQPFAGALQNYRLGCDYISSLHRFLQPKKGHHRNLFRHFYVSLVACSPDIYFASLLDEYVGPRPVVANYVRKQLLRGEEDWHITSAILDRQEGGGELNSSYDCWLWYSGIDFAAGGRDLANAIASRDLRNALFDLTLDQGVHARMLSHYTEFHEARRAIEGFLSRFSDWVSPRSSIHGLWWDGALVPQAPDRHWVSTPLRNHSGFLPVLESWLEDSRDLQACLETFAAETPSVNNPGSPSPVFSESAAAEALKLAKRKGGALDRVRRAVSNDMPNWFFEECESLGLFTTRMPRFQQLFFYQPTTHELGIGLRQDLPCELSRRAAKAYLVSGNRLRSACGISDVWYRYVEDRQDLYNNGELPAIPLEQQPRHPRPRPDLCHEKYLWSVFQWAKMHSRPQPRKKGPARSRSSSIVTEASVIESIVDEISSARPMSGTPTPPPQQMEEIREYPEDEENGSREDLPNEAGELARQDAVGSGSAWAQRASSAVTEVKAEPPEVEFSDEFETSWEQVAGSTAVEVKTESSEYRFDEFPENASFDELLARALDQVPLAGPSAAANVYVPSSVPEEQELRLSPTPVAPTSGQPRVTPSTQAEDSVGEDEMQGVESSQEA